MSHPLLQNEVRTYLLQHLQEDIASFLLRSHPLQLETKTLAQQLFGLQIARKKFPILFQNEQVLYPPKVNLEQSSSWNTALYKSQIYSGESMIDLTGGFGVDVIAFGKSYTTIEHIEQNPHLQEIAAHNFTALQLAITSHNDDGMELLAQSDKSYDLIYIDPSRKTKSNSKAVLLKDYEPDITQHWDLLFKKSKAVLVKTSPMLDISAGMEQFRNVKEIHIVAVKNEVKELLWLCEPGAVSTRLVAVNLESNDPPIFMDLGEHVAPTFFFPKSYLYEPNAAVMKTQCFGRVCQKFGVGKLDHDAHLFTHDELIDFPGRKFQILEIHDYKPKLIKRKYGKSNRAVVTRNFRESVSQLRLKYKFGEHDTNYLFFTSLLDRGPVVIEAHKLEV